MCVCVCVLQRATPFFLPLLQVLTDDVHALVPDIGSLVTARVTTMTSQFIKVEILAVEDRTLPTAYRGMVKKINVRELLVDKVKTGARMCTWLIR